MTYSTFIHSGIVNPAKSKLTKENRDPVDSVTMDIPLLTRILELSREDIKSDVDLHNLLTSILNQKNKGILTMQDYESIVQGSSQKTDELESIKKLAGI
jgi:hypothetical protein